MSVRVKICGVTRAEDARLAVDAGAWAIGVILSNIGPRALDLTAADRVLGAAAEADERVGVFVSPSPAEIADVLARLPLTRIQVHGDLDPGLARALGARLIRARTFRSAADLAALEPDPDELVLLDAAGPAGEGGTGRALDLSILQEFAPSWPFMLAGGLTAESVASAVRVARPYAVDVSSGVESTPGHKDHQKVVSFIENALGSAG